MDKSDQSRLNTIDQIKDRLAKYPQVNYDATKDYIFVYLADGFNVSLYISERDYVVYFDGWHEHFTSEQEAVNCFAFGLSTDCRLKVDYRGETPYRWAVEALKDGQWVADSSTGLLWFPFWRPHRVKYLQNKLVKNT